MSFNSEFGQTGNYMEFYKAIKLMYPDIQMIPTGMAPAHLSTILPTFMTSM
jgi:hypothetical protein